MNMGQFVPTFASLKPPPGLMGDELDMWEPKPRVAASRARDWWKANAARFAPAKLCQASFCVSDGPLVSVFDPLPLAFRYHVYLREWVLTPGTPEGKVEL